ncbi:autotransporter domain-containing protein [Lysobacter arenosi]|uniref:Autotransporter domain-containing protein n=1 Tax=Lysobacter arenosi TaxID=2795387 RepID=A0ABX7RH59_9GAMM|nr:S8 family serine peptidase [Lysobacter arenosi]QSX76196.1 autotransporter domain-containing protein [Lysobacter arenosi]
MAYRERGLVTALRSALLLSAVCGLAACGGGGGGGNVRSGPPPATVTPPTPPPPPPPTPPVVSTPDPQFSQHLVSTNAAAARQAGITGAGVRIGVVDSGVMHNHPALSPRVLENLNYISSPPNNLAIDDVVGHGTAVSQIMAGTPFGAWPGGIAPGAQIVSARIISDEEPKDDGSGSGNEVNGALGLKGIHEDLINRGVRVMNNSWGGLYWTNPAATAAIADEYRPFIISNGGLVVFATGNESKPNPSSMAALPSQPGNAGSLPAADLERGWIAATALEGTNALASYANACGQAMRYCIGALGEVVVTGKDDSPTSPSYWRYRGTSLAAPQISGAAALVWQAFPFFSNDNVRQTLLGTATDLGATGIDATFGNGMLNIAGAIRGPQRLDFGDFTVRFDNSSVIFGNQLTGPGRLVKEGNGTLRLAQSAFNGGGTVVNGGVLISNQLSGLTTIGAQGEARIGASSGSFENQGRLVADGDNITIQGTYHQTAGAELAYRVGAPVTITGATAIDGGDVHVLGVKSGYTWQAQERVLFAMAGYTGRFDALTAAPGVFLQASLRYEPLLVMLDITRLDVTAAAQSMGLSPASVGSAERVEGAFDQIDQGGQSAVDGEFLGAAGAIQQTASAAAAERTLSSLSGELHGADTAFALMAIEGNRRALESRVDALQAAPVAGAWADDLDAQRAMSRFDIDADGWMLGQDHRFGDRLTVGMALSETEGYAHHDLRADREHNRQAEAQLYGAYDLGRGYLLGSVALGRMQRWTQRDILLGAESFRVDADYAQRYATVGLQAGWPIAVGRGRITPYAGVQSLQLDRDGFSEAGAAGFGLSTAASTMTLSQALFGARFAYDWSVGSSLWSLQGRAEWQRLLSQSGGDIDARFTALDIWTPIVGDVLDRDVGVVGLSLATQLRGAGRIGFDVDAQRIQGQTWTRAMATWSLGW